MDIDYGVDCGFQSVAEMKVSVFGRGEDRIRVHEAAILNGAESRAVLTSHLALMDDAQAEIVNEIEANAPGYRGHVDCKEILHGKGKASAIPIVRSIMPARTSLTRRQSAAWTPGSFRPFLRAVWTRRRQPK